MASRTINMTTGDPLKLLVRFSLPLLAVLCHKRLNHTLKEVNG